VRRLRVRKLAKAEIAAACDWYLQHSSTAARQFIEAVDDAIAQIEAAPERRPLTRTVGGRIAGP